MAYNRRGYYRRAQVIQEIVRQHYEPERQDRCKAAIWRRYIYPQFGVCYQSFLRYLNTRVPTKEGESASPTHAVQLELFQ